MLRTGKYLLILLVLFAIFFWKVLFTAQFSVVEDWETANQGYAWHQFAASSIQKGILPIWDPYSQSGRPHIGEMQPGLFYPLKLILYLPPLGHTGLLSVRLFDQYYVLARFLAACFIFLLARELGLKNPVAGLVAGLCFGTAGFIGNAGGLQLLDSAIWLPLVVLFLIRALRSGSGLPGLFYSCLSGLCIAMTILAGSIHVPLMDAIVVVTSAAFLVTESSNWITPGIARRSYVRWTVGVVMIVGVVAFTAASVQILPSLEYAPLAFRWGSGGETLRKMPYFELTSNSYLPPSTVLAFLFSGAAPPPVEAGTSPYMGVLPLFLAIIGVYVYWPKTWVKYLSGTALIAFFYSMASFSFLHGALYVFPILDKAREADRFMYLGHFAIAILAGFGVEAIYSWGPRVQSFLPRVSRFLGIAACTLAAILAAATIYKLGQPEWYFFSFLFFIASWGILAYLARGHRTRMTQFLIVIIIASDLYGFNWTARNRAQVREKGEDYLEQLLAGSDLARFFHEQEGKKGLFRVHVLAERFNFISLGDMFAVQTTEGQSATSLLDCIPLTWSRKGLDILNAHYVAAAGKPAEGKLVLERGKWKVYETDSALPRAWIVSRTVVEPSREEARLQIENPGFDPRRVAIVAEPVQQPLSSREEVPHQISFLRYEANRIEMDVRVDDTGFLVLSEMYYPGWQATVNGNPAKIYRADSVLRGVIVPPGRSRVVFRYRPMSLLIGAGLSLLSVGAVVALGIIVFRNKMARTAEPPSSPI